MTPRCFDFTRKKSLFFACDVYLQNANVKLSCDFMIVTIIYDTKFTGERKERGNIFSFARLTCPINYFNYNKRFSIPITFSSAQKKNKSTYLSIVSGNLPSLACKIIKQTPGSIFGNICTMVLKCSSNSLRDSSASCGCNRGGKPRY